MNADLTELLPGPRDQADRDTCLAFAFSDAHLAAIGGGPLLSPDYLHFHAARRLGVGPNDGVSTGVMQEALEHDGQPVESECPYSPVAREEDWTPPDEVREVWTRTTSLQASDPCDRILAALGAGMACILTLQINEAFVRAVSADEAISPDGRDLSIHAVVVVAAETGDVDRFLVRNSWGADWGSDGHLWLDATYISRRARLVIVPDRNVTA